VFCGQPFCKACGYEGPDFMWSYHPLRGFYALVQNQETLGLRVIEVPDNEVYYRREGVTAAQRERDKASYVDSIVTSELQTGERHVPISEFTRDNPFIEARWDEERVISLPCPRCRTMLIWRNTGIA